MHSCQILSLALCLSPAEFRSNGNATPAMECIPSFSTIRSMQCFAYTSFYRFPPISKELNLINGSVFPFISKVCISIRSVAIVLFKKCCAFFFMLLCFLLLSLIRWQKSHRMAILSHFVIKNCWSYSCRCCCCACLQIFTTFPDMIWCGKMACHLIITSMFVYVAFVGIFCCFQQ